MSTTNEILFTNIVLWWRQKSQTTTSKPLHITSKLSTWQVTTRGKGEMFFYDLGELNIFKKAKKNPSCIVQILILTPLHLAVNNGPLIQSSSYQCKSAKLSHNTASEVCRGPRSGVAVVSVPLVNNRKGSLLPRAEPPALRLSFMGSGDLGQVGRLPAVAEEASLLQRARSLPVKYRYHPSHSNNATLSHRHCKGHLPSPLPLACLAGLYSTTAQPKHVLARLEWLHV